MYGGGILVFPDPDRLRIGKVISWHRPQKKWTDAVGELLRAIGFSDEDDREMIIWSCVVMAFYVQELKSEWRNYLH